VKSHPYKKMLPGIVLLNGKISEDLQVLNRKISKDCHSLGGDSSFFLFSFFSFSFFSGKMAFSGDNGAPMPSHLSTQWAAVSTQFLWMRDPPQVWYQLPPE